MKIQIPAPKCKEHVRMLERLIGLEFRVETPEVSGRGRITSIIGGIVKVDVE